MTGPIHIGKLVGPEAQAKLERQHEVQINRLAGRILSRIRYVEARRGVEPKDLLQFSTARRIAEGFVGDPEAVEEFRRLLDAVEQVEEFRTSPAAYIVASAQRRGWI